MRYTKASCPHCQTNLEYPNEWEGSSINCPACNGAVILKRPAATPSRGMVIFLSLVTIWILAYLGSNLYDDWQAKKSAEQAKIKADQDAKALQAAYEAQAEYQSELKAKRQAAYDESVRERKAEQDKRNLQWQQDQILAEIRRGNEIAEQAERDAAFDRIEKKEPSYQQSVTVTPAATSPQPWVLKYNGFANQWQYAPRDSVLKYNGFENRWEWVPQ